jgi:phage-related protein (TIGR01555 family)
MADNQDNNQTLPKRVSVAAISKKAIREERDRKIQLAKDEAKARIDPMTSQTLDSFVNFAQRMGVGAENALTTSGYGFNPITRVRTTLEWIHRGSWLGGVAVDVVADDMTRAGVELKGDIEPEDAEKIEECAVGYAVWDKLNETIKWGRLYGGCIAVIMIDGQDYSTPLLLDRIGKDQFKGLLVLDRWMVEPSLNNLVTAPGPDMGLPKFYTVTADAPALPRLKVHHSRCIRIVGIQVPYWQRVMENLWGISVLERLYDRMIAYDSATTGAAQLVYKAYIRTYKVKGMREIIAAGGQALSGLVAYVNMMRQFQGIEGVTLMDGDDEFEHTETNAFSGLSDTLTQFGQQLSGALQIPLVRLFGQSPAGFSNGDADLRNYYDTINQQQNKDLKIGVTKIYRAIAASEGVKLPEGFKIKFRSLWQLTEVEKSEIAKNVTEAVANAENSGIISPQTAAKELKQSSEITGIYSNLTDENIKAMSDKPIPPPEDALLNAGGGEAGDTDPPPGGKDPASAAPGEQKSQTRQTAQS